jgi:hypothetical protein
MAQLPLPVQEKGGLLRGGNAPDGEQLREEHRISRRAKALHGGFITVSARPSGVFHWAFPSLPDCVPANFVNKAYYSKKSRKGKDFISDGKRPNARLKGVKHRKGDRRAWMSGTIEVLLKSKAVIGPYENSRQSLLIMSLMRMFSWNLVNLPQNLLDNYIKLYIMRYHVTKCTTLQI